MKSNAKTNTTRRSFLAAGAIVAIGFGTPAWTQVRDIGGNALARLDESLARTLLGSDFVFSADGHQFQTRLSEVSAPIARARKGDFPTQSFSMEFVVAGRVRAGEGLYQVKHAELGAFELFVTAHADRNGEATLVAIFNRL